MSEADEVLADCMDEAIDSGFFNKKSTQKVLFTGERGQLATTIAEYLGGEHVVESPLILRKSCSKHHPWDELDVTNRDELFSVAYGLKPDIIVHSAAVVNTDKAKNDPQRCCDVNVMGTHNVLDVCRELGIKLVYFSTTATYDPAEDNRRPFTELSRQRPPTLYGITKYAGEMLVTGQSEVPWMVIRPCFVYGNPPLDHSSQICRVAVHTALKHLWPEKAGPTPRVTLDPDALKDYMRVEDFSLAVCMLLRDPFWGQTFNISYGTDPKPMGWYFTELEKYLGLKVDMEWDAESDYMRDHIVSSERLRACTAWVPLIDQEEGIKILARRALQYVENCKKGKETLLYR